MILSHISSMGPRAQLPRNGRDTDPSNRRGKKADGKGEQHQPTERTDCDMYRTGHRSITLPTNIGSSYQVITVSSGRQRSYRQILVTTGPVRRRRLWADGQSVWR